jgi:RNA polymerase sigma factor (sigma-70 family)
MQAFDGEHPTQSILNIQATSWPIHLPLPSLTKETDDETLIRLITTGSRAESQNALEAVYIKYHKDVWRYVRSRVSSPIDADEISAAVWLVVTEKIYDFVWQGTPIKTWLFSIAHRKTLEFFDTPPSISLEKLDADRHQALHYIAKQLHLFEPNGSPSPIKPVVKKEADIILHQMISGLSATERKIIMLIYFENVENSTEVAKRLDMNKNTIRVYHKRAKEKLRRSPELSSLFDETNNDEPR